jgi:hypothetical protein
MHGEIYADAQQAADAVGLDVDALSFWATDTPNGLQPLRDIESPTKVRRLRRRNSDPRVASAPIISDRKRIAEPVAITPAIRHRAIARPPRSPCSNALPMPAPTP